MRTDAIRRFAPSSCQSLLRALCTAPTGPHGAQQFSRARLRNDYRSPHSSRLRESRPIVPRGAFFDMWGDSPQLFVGVIHLPIPLNEFREDPVRSRRRVQATLLAGQRSVGCVAYLSHTAHRWVLASNDQPISVPELIQPSIIPGPLGRQSREMVAPAQRVGTLRGGEG